eukprot:Amastigsp_a516913_19.p2 type:complete len:281 gc:universal Amastigsp_a516913_19:581-1423(+)
MRLDHCVVRRKRLEFVRRGDERLPGQPRDLVRNRHVEAGVGVEPCADSGSALRQVKHARRDGGLDTGDAVVKLRHVARELLPERHRHRVHQMRAPDLDDTLERRGLGRKGVAQGAHCRQKLRAELEHCGDVHRGGERVIRRLRHVDVVVRVHGLLRAHRPAEQLDRTVRDDFVDVHVRLGPGPCLEDDKREVVVQAPVDHFIRRGHDRLGDRRGEPEPSVDDRSCFLENRKRVDNLNGHAVAAGEVRERPLRLAAPVPVDAHLKRAHGVGLRPCLVLSAL